MTKFALLLILVGTLFAGTQYVTPNMVVQNSEMYCSDYYGENVITKRIGDIVDGDHAKAYCSYNKETAKDIARYFQKRRDRNFDETSHMIIGYILVSLIFGLIITIIWTILSAYGITFRSQKERG